MAATACRLPSQPVLTPSYLIPAAAQVAIGSTILTAALSSRKPTALMSPTSTRVMAEDNDESAAALLLNLHCAKHTTELKETPIGTAPTTSSAPGKSAHSTATVQRRRKSPSHSAHLESRTARPASPTGRSAKHATKTPTPALDQANADTAKSVSAPSAMSTPTPTKALVEEAGKNDPLPSQVQRSPLPKSAKRASPAIDADKASTQNQSATAPSLATAATSSSHPSAAIMAIHQIRDHASEGSGDDEDDQQVAVDASGLRTLSAPASKRPKAEAGSFMLGKSLFSNMPSPTHGPWLPVYAEVAASDEDGLVQLCVGHSGVLSGRKVHRCAECAKVFPSTSKLVRHSRVHTRDKPFSCILCGTRFTQKSSLKMHLGKHTPSELASVDRMTLESGCSPRRSNGAQDDHDSRAGSQEPQDGYRTDSSLSSHHNAETTTAAPTGAKTKITHHDRAQDEREASEARRENESTSASQMDHSALPTVMHPGRHPSAPAPMFMPMMMPMMMPPNGGALDPQQLMAQMAQAQMMQMMMLSQMSSASMLSGRPEASADFARMAQQMMGGEMGTKMLADSPKDLAAQMNEAGQKKPAASQAGGKPVSK